MILFCSSGLADNTFCGLTAVVTYRKKTQYISSFKDIPNTLRTGCKTTYLRWLKLIRTDRAGRQLRHNLCLVVARRSDQHLLTVNRRDLHFPRRQLLGQALIVHQDLVRRDQLLTACRRQHLIPADNNLLIS